MREMGLSLERVEEFARRGIAWAVPNVLLGAMIILPVWFVIYLFRPPGRSSSSEYGPPPRHVLIMPPAPPRCALKPMPPRSRRPRPGRS